MANTIICVALLAELHSLFPQENLKPIQGNLEAFQITSSQKIAIVTGIGMINTASTVAVAIDRFKPKTIINFGFVGDISGNFNLGDLVIPVQVIHAGSYLIEDGKRLYYQGGLSIKKRHETSPYLPLKPIKYANSKEVLIASNDAFVNDLSTKQRINTETKAEVLDMELFAIVRVATNRGVEVSSIKVISDSLKAKDTEKEFFSSFESQKVANKTIGQFLLKH